LSFEYSLAAKWVELLKEIAPNVKRVGVLRDANVTQGIGQFAVIQSVAPSRGVDVTPINLGDTTEMERDVAALARFADGGLILTASPSAPVHRDLIIALAARHELPAVYIERLFAVEGVCSLMVPTSPTSTAARPATSIASSRARSPLIFLCRHRPNTTW
jgi:putative ABC transport system substrate-binding protein